jgi:hypothetical protein
MQWLFEQDAIDWSELSTLYRIAPLGDKKPDDLRRAFTNSRYKCFVLEDGVLVGAGRAVADGVDCSYICDVAIHPDFGRGLGPSSPSPATSRPATRRSSPRQPGEGGLSRKLGQAHAHRDGHLPGSGPRDPGGLGGRHMKATSRIWQQNS